MLLEKKFKPNYTLLAKIIGVEQSDLEKKTQVSRGGRILRWVIGVAVTLAAVYGAGYWLLSSLKENYLPKLTEMGVQQSQGGKKFGKDHGANDCVIEAMRRDANCDGLICHAGSRIFLKECLSTQKIDPTYCKDVPPRTEIWKSATWSLATCANLEHPDQQACTRVIRPLQEWCHPEA